MRKLTACGALLILAAGCQEPHHSVESIIERQTSALARLPQEERARMMMPDRPVTTAPPAQLLDPGVLTLEEARRLALRTSPDIHAARARLESALSKIAEARSFYFPQVGMSHSSTRTFLTPAKRTRFPTLANTVPSIPDLPENPTLADLINILQIPLFGRPSSSIANQNSFSDHTTMLSLNWTIFDGFVREARLMSAKHSYRASAMSLADAERLLLQSLDAAYHQTQLAEEQIRIARADEEFSREQLADARRRFEAKRITKADVLNFEVRARAARANVVAAVGQRDMGRVLLAELMALPQAVLPPEVQLAPLATEGDQELSPPDAQVWVDRALYDRPDLAAARHQREARSENILLAKGQFAPELSLSGSYGYENISNMAYSQSDQAAALGIELRWQIFTGGFRTSQLRKAQAEWWEAASQVRGKELEVASDVRRAVTDLKNAQEQVKLQRLNLDSARENRRLIEVQYAAGKASLVRLNEAQRDYVETDAELARARINLRRAWSDLHAAAGAYEIDPDDLAPPAENPAGTLDGDRSGP